MIAKSEQHKLKNHKIRKVVPESVSEHVFEIPRRPSKPRVLRFTTPMDFHRFPRIPGTDQNIFSDLLNLHLLSF